MTTTNGNSAAGRPPAPVAEGSTRVLSAAHRALLERGSAIAPEVIAERGYWTASTWQDLDGLAFRQTQKVPESFPALAIPQHDPTGEYTYTVVRWDTPRTTPGGKIIRYDHPAKVEPRLDVPRRCVASLRDAEVPLWVTEGSKKADALASAGYTAISTPGVDGWRSPSALDDFVGIRLKGRRVIIAFDADLITKPQVRAAAGRLTRWLARRGAAVYLLDWRRAVLPGVAS
jgi:hypothetical protein